MELLIQAAEESRIQSRYEPAEKMLREAIDLAAQTGDDQRRLRAIARLAWLLSQMFRSEASLEILLPTLPEMNAADEPTVAALKWVWHALTSWPAVAMSCWAPSRSRTLY